mgnify:FL=1
MRLTVSSNLPGVEEAFSAAVRGIRRYDHSVTADGRTLSLWSGRGMATRQGFGASWRISWIRMFRTQGAATGTPWPDYTDAEQQYAAIKGSIFGRRVGKATKDLNRWIRGSERLMPSMVARTHSEYVQDERANWAAFGTSVPYSSRLHAGIGRAPRHLGGATPPPRPLLGLGRGLKREWRLDLAAFVGEHTSAIGERVSKEYVQRHRAR